MNEQGDPGSLETVDLLGQRTLIVGEINTGKTTLSGRLLGRMVEEIGPDRISVVDLAPVIPKSLARKRGRERVGGRMQLPENKGLLYLTGRIEPPRLSTETEEEAQAAAQRNKIKIERILDVFAVSRREILFVNDISLYLQAGEAGDLAGRLARAGTVVANGYYGQSLGQGLLSTRERREMKNIMGFFDLVIDL